MTAQGLAAVLEEHVLVWDDLAGEWFCGKTGSVCGWHRRVPHEWRDESANAHRKHVADQILAWLGTVAGDAAVREAALSYWEKASHDERWAAREGYDAAVAALLAAVRSA